ncbi:unnamed protein product, partial [Discosporangium mesarthrocarpum]
VTITNHAGLFPVSFKSGNRNVNNFKSLSRINWRACRLPASTVMPAPIAYAKVAAVKELVVGFVGWPVVTGC